LKPSRQPEDDVSLLEVVMQPLSVPPGDAGFKPDAKGNWTLRMAIWPTTVSRLRPIREHNPLPFSAQGADGGAWVTRARRQPV